MPGTIKAGRWIRAVTAVSYPDNDTNERFSNYSGKPATNGDAGEAKGSRKKTVRKPLWKLPVEIWQRGGKYTYNFASTSRIVSVAVDPEMELPDVDDANKPLAFSRSFNQPSSKLFFNSIILRGPSAMMAFLVTDQPLPE